MSGIKTLCMSGFAYEGSGKHIVLKPGTMFIQKPFAQDSLLKKVRAALDSETGP
jgi:hypothetical protein